MNGRIWPLVKHMIDLGKNARATRSVNQYSSHSRWVGTLTTIILLAAVGMTGLWWWQNYQKSNEERDNLVQTYVEKKKTAEEPVTHSNEIPVAVNSQPATSNNETAPVADAKIMLLLNLLFQILKENPSSTSKRRSFNCRNFSTYRWTSSNTCCGTNLT